MNIMTYKNTCFKCINAIKSGRGFKCNLLNIGVSHMWGHCQGDDYEDRRKENNDKREVLK